jgi:hypothetical protein
MLEEHFAFIFYGALICWGAQSKSAQTNTAFLEELLPQYFVLRIVDGTTIRGCSDEGQVLRGGALSGIRYFQRSIVLLLLHNLVLECCLVLSSGFSCLEIPDVFASSRSSPSGKYKCQGLHDHKACIKG